MWRFLVLLSCIPFLILSSSFSQDALRAAENPAPIQDNSFLIEEAYNQEDGVIQHISTFERLTNSRDWVYTQTDEWPFRSYKHQLSVTLAATHAGSLAGRERAGAIRHSITDISWLVAARRNLLWLRV
jgi:hypothetical protein